MQKMGLDRTHHYMEHLTTLHLITLTETDNMGKSFKKPHQKSRSLISYDLVRSSEQNAAITCYIIRIISTENLYFRLLCFKRR